MNDLDAITFDNWYWERFADADGGFEHLSPDHREEVRTIWYSAILAEREWHQPDPRILITLRTSSSAHGFTNCEISSAKVDALPDVAKRELANVMVNIALGLDAGSEAIAARLKAERERENTSPALKEINEERRRQIMKEGWSLAHDDAYVAGELARAASCYAYEASRTDDDREADMKATPLMWPWAGGWWKPTDRRRDLVKAAALIIAEIERLDRKSSSKEAIDGK